jgi:hypothetical protein
MKTIQSSVMIAQKGGSVMTQFPIGSVMSQMAGPGNEL